jgi:hypothetical protein
VGLGRLLGAPNGNRSRVFAVKGRIDLSIDVFGDEKCQYFSGVPFYRPHRRTYMSL